MKKLVFSLILMSGLATVSEATQRAYWTPDEHNALISAVYQKLCALKQANSATRVDCIGLADEAALASLSGTEDLEQQDLEIRQLAQNTQLQFRQGFFYEMEVGENDWRQCFERWRTQGSHINQEPWSRVEEQILLNLLKENPKRTDYSRMAEKLPRRSNKQVQTRVEAFRKLYSEDKLRNGAVAGEVGDLVEKQPRRTIGKNKPWSYKEDQLLVQSIMRFNSNLSWDQLASFIRKLSEDASNKDIIDELRRNLKLEKSSDVIESLVKKLEEEVKTAVGDAQSISAQGWDELFNLIPSNWIWLAILKELPCSEIGFKMDWRAISEQVKTRDVTRCRKRWEQSLNPKVSKELWTKEEEQKLQEAVAELGTSWIKVAQKLGDRSDTQCRVKYEHLSKKKAADPAPIQAQRAPASDPAKAIATAQAEHPTNVLSHNPLLQAKCWYVPGGLWVFIPGYQRPPLLPPFPQLTNTTTRATSGEGVAHTDPSQESTNGTEKAQEEPKTAE